MDREGAYKTYQLNGVWSSGISEQREYVYCNRYQAHNDDRKRYCKKGVPEAPDVLIGNRISEQAELLINYPDNKKHCHSTDAQEY